MVKIKSITFFNHPVFGSKTFDFTINNIAADNIIFAGENGSGKIKLLEELNNVVSESYNVGDGRFKFPFTTHIILFDISDDDYYSFDDEKVKLDEITLTISKNEGNNTYYGAVFKKNGTVIENVKKHGLSEKLRSFKINGLYSNVDVNYKPRSNINGITNKMLDDNNYRSSNDLAYDVTQLLVDISTQDSCDMATWMRNNNFSKDLPANLRDPRMKRFTNAFKYIFGDKIEFHRIESNSIPTFKKNGKNIDLSSMSSGEKQIIFRGVYLLKNINSLKGVPVFIDEPEISMHPKWEDKIFDYYINIFSENGDQTSQIFVATHSEHVLANALNKENCLVYKLDSNEKFYKGSSGNILPTITFTEIKYSIFGICTTDFHSLLYGYIQENLVPDKNGIMANNPSVKKTDDWLIKQNVTKKKYYKVLNNGRIKHYNTLPTYIRNCVDHPDDAITYTYEDLKKSTEEMIKIIKGACII